MLPKQRDITAEGFLRHAENDGPQLHERTNGSQGRHSGWHQSVHAGFAQLRVC